MTKKEKRIAVFWGEIMNINRTMMGITLQQISDELGVSKMTVSKWERDQAQPRPRYIPRIAAILNISPKRLVKFVRES